MSNLSVFQPQAKQPISANGYEMLKMQNAAFETLNIALQRLDHSKHRVFLVRSLTIILDLPGLDDLSTVELADLLFSAIEGATESRTVLDVQNVLIFSTQLLEGCSPSDRCRNAGR